MANVAFLGTGLLGSGIVDRMLRNGETVTVWNRTDAKARALERLGAKVAASPADAVANADRVHMTLPDDTVVDAIVASFRPRLRGEAVVVDHSTTAPMATKARLDRLTRDGVRFLHAPVFMSPQMARDGVGLMMVSGAKALFESIREPLAKMTGEVWYCGEAGERAAAFKLFGNSMLFVIAGGLADVFAMAKGVGMAPAEALEVFSKFQPGNIIKSRGEKMARGDFEASFELTMARKDLRLMIEAAADQPMVVLPSVAKRMDDAIAAGRGREDLGAIAAEVVG
jgi:3-hydroxyisobutyrate dehydrogenase